jgi:hypothetical protein
MKYDPPADTTPLVAMALNDIDVVIVCTNAQRTHGIDNASFVIVAVSLSIDAFPLHRRYIHESGTETELSPRCDRTHVIGSSLNKRRQWIIIWMKANKSLQRFADVHAGRRHQDASKRLHKNALWKFATIDTSFIHTMMCRGKQNDET